MLCQFANAVLYHAAPQCINLDLVHREGLEEQRMWQEAEKILEVEAREAEFRVRREVEEAKREAEATEAELKRAKVRHLLIGIG